MQNRTILYTGAAGGLGLQTTLNFLARGATVVAVDHDDAKIAALTTAAAAASLCYAWRAAGLTALMISGGFGVVTFAVGLVYVLVRRAHD